MGLTGACFHTAVWDLVELMIFLDGSEVVRLVRLKSSRDGGCCRCLMQQDRREWWSQKIYQEIDGIKCSQVPIAAWKFARSLKTYYPSIPSKHWLGKNVMESLVNLQRFVAILLMSKSVCLGAVLMMSFCCHLQDWADEAFSALKDAGGTAYSNYAVGFNNVKVPAATANGIPVGNTPGMFHGLGFHVCRQDRIPEWCTVKGCELIDILYAGVLTETTAELAAALTLSAARRVVESDYFMRAGKYEGWLPKLFVGNLLQVLPSHAYIRHLHLSGSFLCFGSQFVFQYVAESFLVVQFADHCKDKHFCSILF